jgi:pSer/pThr/pTyr-binding forkhead associated (FHA) protein
VIVLLVRRPDGTVAEYVTDQAQILLGKGPTCDVCYEDHPNQGISREHARITFEPAADGGWYMLEDLSKNGTYVHGRRIAEPHALRAGDRVQLGVDGPQLTVQLRVPLDEWQSVGPRVPWQIPALAVGLISVLVGAAWFFLG